MPETFRPSKPKRRSNKAVSAVLNSGPYTAELGLPSSPAAKRTVSPKPGASRSAPKSPKSDKTKSEKPKPSPATASDLAMRFDEIVNYREDLVTDFDALASEHPRSSVLAALAIGLALGFVLGYCTRRGR